MQYQPLADLCNSNPEEYLAYLLDDLESQAAQQALLHRSINLPSLFADHFSSLFSENLVRTLCQQWTQFAEVAERLLLPSSLLPVGLLELFEL